MLDRRKGRTTPPRSSTVLPFVLGVEEYNSFGVALHNPKYQLDHCTALGMFGFKASCLPRLQLSGSCPNACCVRLECATLCGARSGGTCRCIDRMPAPLARTPSFPVVGCLARPRRLLRGYGIRFCRWMPPSRRLSWTGSCSCVASACDVAPAKQHPVDWRCWPGIRRCEQVC